MKNQLKAICSKASVIFVATVIFAATASAVPTPIYTVDGNLSDWGVSPFVSWSPSSPEVVWDEDNYTGSGAYPNGGEAFDVEALYAEVDSDYLYLALVFSMPQAGVDDPYGRPIHYFPGDIALDLDNDGSTGEYGYEFGLGLNSGNEGEIFGMPDWSLPNGSVGFPENTPSTIESGTFLADALFAYTNAGDLEGNGTDTYVVEAAILLSDIGVEFGAGDSFLVHYTLDCGNDLIEVEGLITETSSIPEPSTVMGIAMGLMFVANALRCKISRRQK